jgi:hypothetical protein
MAGIVGWQWHDAATTTGVLPPRLAMTASEQSRAAALAASIKARWNIEARYAGDTNGFTVVGTDIPSSWKLEPVAGEDVVPGLKAIESALQAYPESYVRSASRQAPVFFLVRSIKIGDLGFGGMFSASAMYIPVADMGDRYDVTFAQDTVHHEFALTGLYGGTSPQDSWRAANEPGYVYPAEGGNKPVIDAAEHAPDADAATDQVHAAGFVVKYAESSLVEDWQTYAEQVFGHPADLVELVKRFPRIKAKARIFIDHYETLDPAFRTYFDHTGLAEVVER